MTEYSNNLLLPPAHRPSRWPRVIAMVAIFLAGTAVGFTVGGHRARERFLAALRDPEQIPDRVLPEIRKMLDLSETQSRQVESIIRRRHAAMESIRAGSYPELFDEFQGMRMEVSSVLMPEQQVRWSAHCNTVENRYLPRLPAGPPPTDFLFETFDMNTDGYLSENEVPPPMWMRLKNADADGDHRVSRSEYTAAKRKAAHP